MRQMFQHRLDLEQERSRVCAVQPEEVKHGGHLRRRKVAAPVSHHAVRDLEHQFHRRLARGLELEHRLAQGNHVDRPLHPPAEIQKPPARPARHILELQPTQGGQIKQKRVQELHRL